MEKTIIISSIKAKNADGQSIVDMIGSIHNENSDAVIKQVEKVFNDIIKVLDNETRGCVSKHNRTRIPLSHSIGALLFKYKVEFLTSKNFNDLCAKNQGQAEALFNMLFSNSSKYMQLYDQYYKEGGIIDQIKQDFIHETKNIIVEGQGLSDVFGREGGTDSTTIRKIGEIKIFDDFKASQLDINALYERFSKSLGGGGNVINLYNIQMNEKTTHALCLMSMQADPRDIGMLGALVNEKCLLFDDTGSRSIKPSFKSILYTVGHIVIIVAFAAAIIAVLATGAYIAAGTSSIVSGLGTAAGTAIIETGLFKAQQAIVGRSMSSNNELSVRLPNIGLQFVAEYTNIASEYIKMPIMQDRQQQQCNKLNNGSGKAQELTERIFRLADKINENITSIKNLNISTRMIMEHLTLEVQSHLLSVGIGITKTPMLSH